MKRRAFFGTMLIVALAAALIPPPLASIAAQEATPCPLWPQNEPGIISWEVSQFSQWPSTILVQFDPGASREGTTTGNPSVLSLIYMQSGILTLESAAPMTIFRGDENGAPETIEEETEVTVEAGDYFTFGPIAPAIRNDTNEPATYQSAEIYTETVTIIAPCAPQG
jgi:hypothetical protein